MIGQIVQNAMRVRAPSSILFVCSVMVLDKGSIVEFDSPGSLLAQRGIFHSMAVAVGLAN